MKRDATIQYRFLQLIMLTASCLWLLLDALPVQALEVPAAQGYVTDLTDTLDRQFINQLEQELYNFEKKTSNQIVLVLIPTLAGDNLESFSLRLAETWQVGQQGKDNGVIVLIVKQDRKIRIEVGYGLEGAIPDSAAGSIIRQIMAPRFREGDFEGGIDAAVKALMAATRGEYQAAPGTVRSEIPWFFGLPFIALFMMAGGAVLGHALSYLKHRKIPAFLFVWAAFFCGIALFMAFTMLDTLAWVEVALLAAATYTGYRFMPYKGGEVQRTGSIGGWSIVSGAGHSGSGGFSSGGFSGGGGGSFGGGGASGSW